MSQLGLNASKHYLGQEGRFYFSKKFGSDMEFGRIFQSLYFLPYCNDNLNLLDFGCADGTFLRHLPAHERIGVEANPVARSRCQEICKESMHQIELHESLESIKSNRVDVAISNHCIEHVLEPFNTMMNILRVLKPNGLFVLIVPFDDYRSQKNKSWKAGDLDNHLYTWSPMNLGNLMSEVGFKVEQITLHTRAWSPKMFWLYRAFGEPVFRIFCHLLGTYKRHHEVFGIGVKPVSSNATENSKEKS